MRPSILAITVNQNEEIVSRLLDSGEDGEEETDNFADFYGFLAKKAVELAKAYQPKLRDGIKVAVEMLNSVAKDERPIPKGECLGDIQVSEPRQRKWRCGYEGGDCVECDDRIKTYTLQQRKL